MSDQLIARPIWKLFGTLLDYPHEPPISMLEECRALVTGVSAEAEAQLAEFQAFAETADLGALQEEYTRAFDMDESHSLYLGYHLLGESYKRSALLLELKERFREQGMEVVGELADHLPVVLRFLAMSDDIELTNEIVTEAIWPTLEMMALRDQESEEEAGAQDRPLTVAPPYHRVVAALLSVVRLATPEQEPFVFSGVEADWQPLTITAGPSPPPTT